MKRALGLFTVVFGTHFFVSAQALDLKYFNNGSYQNVKIESFEGFKINSTCLASKPPKCQAYLATKIKLPLSKSPLPVEGHPAARYCLDHKALNRILLDKDRKQYDYCLFTDGSLIDSWDLFYYNFPKQVIH